MAFRISPPRLAAFAVKQLIPDVGTSSAEQRPHKSGNHLNHPSIVVKDFGPAVHDCLGRQLLPTLVGLSFLHLYRGLGATGVVFRCIIGAVKASMKHEYTAKAQAYTQLFHDRLPTGE